MRIGIGTGGDITSDLGLCSDPSGTAGFEDDALEGDFNGESVFLCLSASVEDLYLLLTARWIDELMIQFTLLRCTYVEFPPSFSVLPAYIDVSREAAE